jgi:PTH1 family peptidyl-tRNA hydrolase
MSEQVLIVGLGNPGTEYANTRHNVGFHCVTELARTHQLIFERRKKSKAKIAMGPLNGKRVILANPYTFMNRSGMSVQGLSAFYKIPAERILVIYDDLDLPLGTVRIRSKGGSGGHKGVSDIIQRLGTQDFPRIRFGIGRPQGSMDPAVYVLLPFKEKELPLVKQTIEHVIQAIETWLDEGLEVAMSRFNGPTPPEPDPNHQPPLPASSDQTDK